MKFSTLAIAAAALIGAVTPAVAGTYAVHYTATGGSSLPTTADFRITTTDVLNALGGFDILSATGKINGVAITALASINPTGFLTNNVFYANAPYLDMYGFGWTMGSTTGNLFFTGGDYTLAQFDPALPQGHRYFHQSNGDVTVAAVPEPASWAMLIVGFVAVGAASRRRVHALVA